MTFGSHLLLAGLIIFPFVTDAQIIQTWTQQSLVGDRKTPGESSAAIGVDAKYMFVADNEHEFLRLYERFPTNPCAAPIYTFNAHPYLKLSDKNPEVDLEAAVLVKGNGTNRIYWLGSHSNSKQGKLRPNRNRLFATDVSGDGTGPIPYALKYTGRYEHLRSDLITWDETNGHGKGSNHFGLRASAAAGVVAEAVNGFNIEGLCLAPDGVTAYLAFRAPLVGQTNALVIPLLNLSELVASDPVSGPGKAKFGAPFTLNLGGRGIRSIDSNHPGHYLIVAGPAGDEGDFRLFTWTGNPADAPVERQTKIPKGLHPEGSVLPGGPLNNDTIVQLVSDDSVACWRSFTVRVGPAK